MFVASEIGAIIGVWEAGSETVVSGVVDLSKTGEGEVSVVFCETTTSSPMAFIDCSASITVCGMLSLFDDLCVVKVVEVV